MAQSALKAVPATEDTTPDVETLARMIVNRQEQVAAISEEIEQMKQALAEQLPQGGQAGPYKVQVTTARRKDLRKLEAALPVTQHPGLYKPALVTAKVDAYFELHPELNLDEFLVAGKPSIKVL